jgi:GDP/UDP-N,N'-diacetylbacillosamine 2-epimerase (hydrolysing)
LKLEIGILTSSRADFGVYLPLLEKLHKCSKYDLKIIAFGTHLSKDYGYTLHEITDKGYQTFLTVDTLPADDNEQAIAFSIGDTVKKFSRVWNKYKFDVVFALGDRYEMFAAVSAGTPFGVKFCHIFGGETTLGAIDDNYRHSISLFSQIIFCSTSKYKDRAQNITGKNNAFNVGSLGFDNLKKMQYLSILDIKNKYQIDLGKETILFTFHPETVNLSKNAEYIEQIFQALEDLTQRYQILITMPNSDPKGLFIRHEIVRRVKTMKNIVTRESLGSIGYLSCMKYCSFMLGNSSSGYSEASFFPKWVIDLGDRQKGRIVTPNIKNIKITKKAIINAVREIEGREIPKYENIYGNGNSADKIIKILDQYLEVDNEK